MRMKGSPPRYLLISRSGQIDGMGHWEFVLEAADGSERLVVEDCEPGLGGERLALLAVVRGLEALGQPSQVTLMTPSAYVREGIRYGLPQWRRNGWRWECFGEMVPVKHRDLWRRVDRALRFHQLECRTFRWDRPHGPEELAGARRLGRRRAGRGRAVSAPRGPFSLPSALRTWLQWTGAGWAAVRRWWRGVRDRVVTDLGWERA